MHHTPSFPLTLTFVALVVVLFIFLMQGIFQGLERARHGNVRGVLILSAVGIMGWLFLLASLATKGYFREWSAMPPHIMMAPGVPILLTVVLAFLPGFRKAVRTIPGFWPVSLQVFRVVVEIILWRLFAEGFVPERMTFEGWNFDVIVGLTAIPVAWFCFRKQSWPRWVALLWNLMGLSLLSTIVLISAMSMPTPMQVFFEEPANRLMSHAPWVWLPGFLLPVAFFLHVVSLIQLLGNKSQ